MTFDGRRQVRKGLRVKVVERELTAGRLSKDASFRLIVSGQVGVKEIDSLIAQLQGDKDILAEQDEGDDEQGFGPER